MFSLAELLFCKGIIQNVRIIAILYEKTGKSFGEPFKLFYSYGIINKIDFFNMKESRCVALSQFTISLSKIMKELSLETIYMPSNPDELLVCSPDVNRPGLESYMAFLPTLEKDRILL